MMDVDQFRRLKREVEENARRGQRAEGVREEVLRQLKEEHGVDGEEAAQKLLKKISRELSEAEADLEKAAEEWDKQYAERVGDE